MSSREEAEGKPTQTLAMEAAHWFAHMRGPDAEASQDGFETWLAESAEHRRAYNRAAEIFAMGKLLAEPAPAAPAPRRPKVVAYAVTLCATGALAVGGWAILQPTKPHRGPASMLASAAIERRSVSTLPGETRVARLADGSVLRLEGASQIDVEIDGARRTLRLVRGQARFEVAEEDRPFIVNAGGGRVTARGTVFDVCLSDIGKVDVRLIRGSIEVMLPPMPGQGAKAATRRLASGESLSFSPAPAALSARPGAIASSGAAAPAIDARSAAREFSAVPVSALVARANRGSHRPIRLADRSLAAQRVSGRFRVDDTELLAERLAALFGVRADRSDPREIVLRP